MGLSPPSGMIMLGAGAALIAASWLATARLRCSRTDPKPLRDADAVVLVPSFMACPVVMLGGLVRIRSTVLCREQRFARLPARRRR